MLVAKRPIRNNGENRGTVVSTHTESRFGSGGEPCRPPAAISVGGLVPKRGIGHRSTILFQRSKSMLVLVLANRSVDGNKHQSLASRVSAGDPSIAEHPANMGLSREHRWKEARGFMSSEPKGGMSGETLRLLIPSQYSTDGSRPLGSYTIRFVGIGSHPFHDANRHLLRGSQSVSEHTWSHRCKP